MKLTSPFPDVFLDQAWAWLHEFPDANFDDYAPKDFTAMVEEIQRRARHGERSWCVENEAGEPCGIIGYQPLTPRLGGFHGICFARGKSTRLERRAAVRQVLGELYGQGVEKVVAGFFATNCHIWAFLRELGFHQEGYFSRHTVKNGELIDIIQVAKFREGC